jgi:hypothetical protein
VGCDAPFQGGRDGRIRIEETQNYTKPLRAALFRLFLYFVEENAVREPKDYQG